MLRAARKGAWRRIADGVDTHGQTHRTAVTAMNGARITDAQFPATSG
jgi:hypothetical protein